MKDPKQIYCAQPFYNMHIEGEHKWPCCLMYEYEHAHQGSVESAWQGAKFTEIRNAFREGWKHSACNTCWHQESVDGAKSQRLSYTAKQHDLGNPITYDADTLRTISWSFGNTCNFACRTCSLTYSTGWLNETKRMAEQGDAQARKRLDEHSKKQFDNVQWEQIEPMLHDVVYLDMIGGETLINPKLPGIMEQMIERGYARNINLMLTTNGSTGPTDTWIKRLREFKSLRLNFSIDAVTEDTFKYVRTGNWNEVSQNIDDWKAQDWVGEIRCNPSFSILNIWDCDRILAWLDKKFGFLNVGYNWVEFPKHYNAVNLPEPAKQDIQDKSRYWHSKKILSQLWSSKSYDTYWQEFIKRTAWLDQSRGESVEKLMPGLATIIHKYSKGTT